MKERKIPLEPAIWLVGVPIGTARDITLRALDVLASADILAAEDTRSLRKLMDIHGIAREGRQMVSLHDHTGPEAIQSLVSKVASGQSLAYASEAGMPLVADPGYELVTAAHRAGLKVTSAPGPSAVTTALALSGLGSDTFHFVGFLPVKRAARQRALDSLRDIPATLVLFESPKRLGACLADAKAILGPDRAARICRELTKKFEEIIPGTLDDLAEQFSAQTVKGEIVLLIDRPAKQSKPMDLESALRDAFDTMSLKDAAAHVAEMSGQPKRDVYQMALKLRELGKN